MTKLLVDALGWIGALSLIVAYFYVSFRKIAADGALYQFMMQGKLFADREYGVLPVVSIGVCERRVDCDHKVLLDADLAELYGVSVKRLNQQVKRNKDRFPPDFAFQLTAKEHEALRLQFATSNKGRGGRRFAPYAFTEHGAIMAATVLNSERAIEMSVFVVRAFVRLRESMAPTARLGASWKNWEAVWRNTIPQFRKSSMPSRS